MADNKKEISRDALEITKNLIDLTKELAVTNHSLSQVGNIVTSHSKIFYGDEQGKGGLLVRVAASEEAMLRHETLLNQLETSCGEVVKSLNVQLIITKQQGESITRLYKMMFIFMGATLFILVALGLVGWKEIASLLASMGL